MNITEKLIKLIENKGITAYRIKKDTGISASTIADYKKGKYSPSYKNLEILIQYLGTSMEYLLENTDDETNKTTENIDHNEKLTKTKKQIDMELRLRIKELEKENERLKKMVDRLLDGEKSELNQSHGAS